jgi:transposase
MMTEPYWLTLEQMARLAAYVHKSHGSRRSRTGKVASEIIFVVPNGVHARAASRKYRPYKTLYNRWKRRGEMRVFGRMLEGLAAQTRGQAPS